MTWLYTAKNGGLSTKPKLTLPSRLHRSRALLASCGPVWDQSMQEPVELVTRQCRRVGSLPFLVPVSNPNPTTHTAGTAWHKVSDRKKPRFRRPPNKIRRAPHDQLPRAFEPKPDANCSAAYLNFIIAAAEPAAMAVDGLDGAGGGMFSKPIVSPRLVSGTASKECPCCFVARVGGGYIAVGWADQAGVCKGCKNRLDYTCVTKDKAKTLKAAYRVLRLRQTKAAAAAVCSVVPVTRCCARVSSVPYFLHLRLKCSTGHCCVAVTRRPPSTLCGKQ